MQYAIIMHLVNRWYQFNAQFYRSMKCCFLFFLMVNANCAAIAQAQVQKSTQVRGKKLRTELTKIGKHVVLIYAKEFYRDYGIPLIETFIISGSGESNDGKRAYRVTFYYDRTKENLGQDYAAKVYIWANNKRPYMVTLANAEGFGLH